MSEKKPAVLILAPRSYERFLGVSAENQFQILTRSGHMASLGNLSLLFQGSRESELSRGWQGVDPMAGHYLESFLKIRGYPAQALFQLDDGELADALGASDPLAIVLSTTYITTVALLEACLLAIRDVAKGVPVIVGGPFIWKQQLDLVQRRQAAGIDGDPARALVVEEALFNAGASNVVREAIYVANEFGEHTLIRLLERMHARGAAHDVLRDIPNLVLAESDHEWHDTGTEPEPVDLDADYTRWDLIDKMPRMVPMRTSVGCPYRCRYCDYIKLHPRVVMRSPASIVAEIKLAKARRVHFFNFIDDNIFLSKKRVRQLVDAIVDNELSINWGGFFRVDRIDEENIDAIYRSGCRFGLCGIESGDSAMLRRMRKGCKQEEIHRGIELATAAGINTLLTFIVGYPGETDESVDATAAFINQLSTGRAHPAYQAYPFYLLPGTEVSEPAYRRKYAIKGRFSKWSHRTMTSDEALHVYAPRLFRKVEALPYDYYGNDSPVWLDLALRDRAFRRRKSLTEAFLGGYSDDRIQSIFADLYETLTMNSSARGKLAASGGLAQPAPRWQDFLSADRAKQPGGRQPLMGMSLAATQNGPGAVERASGAA